MVASFSVLFNQASAGGIRSEHPVALVEVYFISNDVLIRSYILLNAITFQREGQNKMKFFVSTSHLHCICFR